MYYAGMRPAEVINLRKSQCRLPRTGWGLLNLKGGIVTAGKEWSDDGAVHEAHSLKRRSAKTTRPVPIPPVLVRMLIEHIARFGVTADGRTFQNAAGNYIDAVAYGITWGRAREFLAGTRDRANQLVEDSMNRWEESPASDEAGLSVSWPGNTPDQLVIGGIAVGQSGSKEAFRLAV
ncbi:hypothetical protein ACFY3G_39195 [Streptomyces phaeochromogenes]|uniref:hypothetical protein n=1 Tax=Streptomyces phaeochromogenes TaxID=1923 RepID=UPI0036AE791E